MAPKLVVLQPNVRCMNMEKTINFQLTFLRKLTTDSKKTNYLCLNRDLELKFPKLGCKLLKNTKYSLDMLPLGLGGDKVKIFGSSFILKLTSLMKGNPSTGTSSWGVKHALPLNSIPQHLS